MVEALKKRKPVTPGQRFMTFVDFSVITEKSPKKSLVSSLKRTGGRNNFGNITSRFRGGGAKRAYRTIDFKRDKEGIPAVVKTIEYDPNRSAYIALLNYADGEKRYIIAPNGVTVGQKIYTGKGAEPETGNAMPLKDIPLGMQIHNVELRPGRGGQLARSAGSSVKLTAKEGKYANITLPSGEIRKVLVTCVATIGQVSNVNYKLICLGKAGVKRNKGRRPHNRGTSMNPVDHPMGGGEGRTAGGRHPTSPWGKLAKGGKTRKRRNVSNKFILRGRKK